MPIVKILKREPGYVQIDNRVINDYRLSWKAKGILVYLLSKPNDWKVQLEDLINKSPDGMHSVRAALSELMAAGYATRELSRTTTGTFSSWDYTIREEPLRGYPQMGKPQVDKPLVENRTLNNKEITNKESTNTYRGDEENDSYSQMRDLLERLTGLIVAPPDTVIINQFIKDGVIEEDIRAALQWRKDQGLKPAKTISQLSGGVNTNRAMRIQISNARPVEVSRKMETVAEKIAREVQEAERKR